MSSEIINALEHNGTASVLRNENRLQKNEAKIVILSNQTQEFSTSRLLLKRSVSRGKVISVTWKYRKELKSRERVTV